MKKYGVTIPTVGYVYVEVEVEDNTTEEEIIEEAFDKANENFEDSEWELTSKIVDGNVCYASVTEIDITEL